MLLRRWYNNDFFWRFNLMAPPFSNENGVLCECLSVLVENKRPTTSSLPSPFLARAPNNHPKGVGGDRFLLLFSFLIYIHFASFLLNFSSTHVYINVNVNLFLFWVRLACLPLLRDLEDTCLWQNPYTIHGAPLKLHTHICSDAIKYLDDILS